MPIIEMMTQVARKSRPRSEPKAGVSARRYFRAAAVKQIAPTASWAAPQTMYSQLREAVVVRMEKMELPMRGVARTVVPGRSMRTFPWEMEKPTMTAVTIQRKAVWAMYPKNTTSTQTKMAKVKRMRLAMAQREKEICAPLAAMAPMRKFAMAMPIAWAGAPMM